jgi:hypothetical protein
MANSITTAVRTSNRISLSVFLRMRTFGSCLNESAFCDNLGGGGRAEQLSYSDTFKQSNETNSTQRFVIENDIARLTDRLGHFG